MRGSVRTLGAIFGLVVLSGIISAAIFVAFGTQLAVSAVLVLAPMLVVVGGLWVRRQISATGTNQSQYTQRRAREVGEMFSDAWSTRGQMQREYPEVAADRLGLGVDTLTADLQKAGIEFDRQNGTFTLNSIGKLENINSLADRVDSFSANLEPAFITAAESEVSELNSTLDRISNIVEANQGPDTPDVPENNWREAGTTVIEAREYATSCIDRGAQNIQRAIGEADSIDADIVEEKLEAARAATADNQFEQAVSTLLDAQDTVRFEAEDTFSTRKQQLESLLATIETRDMTNFLPGNKVNVTTIREELDSLTDAMEVSQLTDLQATARERCLNIVADLEQELEDVVGQLKDADVPDGFYSKPEAYGHNYTARVRQADDLPSFEQEWADAVDQLTETLETLSPKADVVSGYDHVREVIESELRKTGEITGDDLPVREHHDQFLGLYFRENPDKVSFDIDYPRLTVAGDGESYDVNVSAQFERGGPEREVNITLTGDNYSDAKTVATPIKATATFESVPFGEYAVEANPVGKDFKPATAEVQVSDDTGVFLELIEYTLRDRICDGIEEQSEEYLNELDETLAARFDDEDYLDSSMSYRIDSEYIPCLLVLWADRSGQAVVECDDGIMLVFDETMVQGEIENVVTYNLDEGESIALVELRDRFLSVPTPDHVIADLVEGEIPQAAVKENTLIKS